MAVRMLPVMQKLVFTVQTDQYHEIPQHPSKKLSPHPHHLNESNAPYLA
jgi:hypothetical protein